MYELLSLKHAFFGYSLDALLNTIKRGHFDKRLPENYSADARQLCLDCLQVRRGGAQMEIISEAELTQQRYCPGTTLALHPSTSTHPSTTPGAAGRLHCVASHRAAPKTHIRGTALL